MQDWIQDIFAEQYREAFGDKKAGPLEPESFDLVEEVDGQRVAVLQAQQTLETAHIKALVVQKEYRGRGLGLSLLKQLEVKAKTRGIKSITLSTKSYQAKDFYLKAGYQIYATLENVPQAGITKYHFIKWLSE